MVEMCDIDDEYLNALSRVKADRKERTRGQMFTLYKRSAIAQMLSEKI